MVLCLGVVGGCGDGAGPSPSVEVVLSVADVRGPLVLPLSDSVASVVCFADLTAAATGSGSATWLDGTVLWSTGSHRDVIVGDSSLSAERVQARWNGTRMLGGAVWRSTWRLEYSDPFTASVNLRYRLDDEGEVRTAGAILTCGPEASDSTQVPEITSIAVAPASGEIEPADTLRVIFRAEAQAGLWRSEVRLSGPCQATARTQEALGYETTDTVRLVLPRSCQLGQSPVVEVSVVDGAGRRVTRQERPALLLVDRTPPDVVVLQYPREGPGTTTIGGRYFVGDSTLLTAYASDNHALAALDYEARPVGVRRTFPLADSAAEVSLTVRFTPEWAGRPQVRFTARDVVGLVSDTVASEAGAFQVYPTVERPIAVAGFGFEVRDVAFDLRRQNLLLLETAQQRVGVVSLGTLALTEQIDVPDYATDFDVTPGGDSLILALPGLRALGVIDLARTPHVVETIVLGSLDTAAGQRPREVRALANGRVFVSMSGTASRALTLLDVDLRTGAQRWRADAGDRGYIGAGILARSLDHTVLFLNGGTGLLQRYHAASDTFGSLHSPQLTDWRPAVDLAGDRVALSLDVYDGSLQFLRRVDALGGGYPPSALSSDGRVVFSLLSPLGILRSRVEDGVLLDRTFVPMQPNMLRVSADGAWLVAVAQQSYFSGTIGLVSLR